MEPNLLDNVFIDLFRVTKIVGFSTVHSSQALRHLSDGRNAHLVQEPVSWWLPKLEKYFEVGGIEHHEEIGKGFSLVVGPKVSSTGSN